MLHNIRQHLGRGLLRRQYIQRVYRATILFLLSLCFGVFGYIFIEGYTLIEAIYMTVITISTVGFTEVKPLSDAGRLFTAVLIIVNIGIFAYVISILTSFVMEWDLRKLLKIIKVDKQIQSLEGHIIVCGYGRLGMRVVEELGLGNKDFVVIESDSDLIENMTESGLQLIIEGDAMDEEVLSKANLKNAAALITTLPKDADNVFVVLSSRQLNPQIFLISRASVESSVQKLKHAGADHVVMPENLGGTHMAKLITKPDIVEFISLVSGHNGVNIYFEECTLMNFPEKYHNKSINELNVRKLSGANIIGLREEDGTFEINPPAETILNSATKLILLGTREQIVNFKKTFELKDT